MHPAAETSTRSVRNPATPEAIAALRAHPRFPEAIRASAAGLVALYQGSHLLNWLMDDRGRLLFGYFALYLHFTRDPTDPSSGLTPTRMKAGCAEFEICSPGRAVAMLSLMRFAGYLAPAPTADRRVRGLVATDRLINLLVERWRVHFAALAVLRPEGEAALASLDDPSFVRHLVIAMTDRFRAGFRFLTHAPGVGLFGERNAGMLILTTLLTAGEQGDTVPPQRPVPVSISRLARAFSVSRPHVLKLIRDAADEGLIARDDADGGRIVILPRLAEATQDLFASMFLFYVDCTREALERTKADAAA
jgi:hypothetical protein